MRILQILPGSGDGFYCENCVRDHSLVRALIRAGQEVVVAPLYLPQFVDPLEAAAGSPVFYGGINTYLQQKSGFFRKTPRWFDRILDSRFLLGLAAKRAGSVRASDLGEMTLSVLKGEEGNQAKELERLLAWVERSEKPDVVHLSSPLLLAIGLAIKKRLGARLVCTLQDEDAWIDSMAEPSRTLCWEAMADGAKGVDAFVAVSRFFGDLMRDRLKISPHVVPIGVDPGDPPSTGPAPDPPVLGYLARMSESMGLGLLAEAFLKLRKDFPRLRLHLSGGRTGDDEEFLKRLKRKFSAEGVERDVEIFGEFDPASRRRFLGGLSILSVPTPHGTAFGTYILEALARGVPVVQPRVGSFPELIEATGGGVLVEPGDAGALARALGALLGDERRRSELGLRGRESVVRSFGLDTMAKNMIEIYRGVL